MNAKSKVELKLNKKSLKNLSLDENVIPRSITRDINGGGSMKFGEPVWTIGKKPTTR